jgi:hypothetical protein
MHLRNPCSPSSTPPHCISCMRSIQRNRNHDARQRTSLSGALTHTHASAADELLVSCPMRLAGMYRFHWHSRFLRKLRVSTRGRQTSRRGRSARAVGCAAITHHTVRRSARACVAYSAKVPSLRSDVSTNSRYFATPCFYIWTG